MASAFSWNLKSDIDHFTGQASRKCQGAKGTFWPFSSTSVVWIGFVKSVFIEASTQVASWELALTKPRRNTRLPYLVPLGTRCL